MSKEAYPLSKLESLKYKIKKILGIKSENWHRNGQYLFWDCDHGAAIEFYNVVELKNPTEFEWLITYKQTPEELKKVRLVNCVMV